MNSLVSPVSHLPFFPPVGIHNARRNGTQGYTSPHQFIVSGPRKVSPSVQEGGNRDPPSPALSPYCAFEGLLKLKHPEG